MESNNGPVDFERTWSVVQLLYNNHKEKMPGGFLSFSSSFCSFDHSLIHSLIHSLSHSLTDSLIQ